MSADASPLRVRVARRTEEADAIAGFELVPVSGTLPGWEPGAHIDVHVPGAALRQYSLCGPPGSSSYHIGVLRDPASRGGSAALHDAVHAGAELDISAPRNHFALAQGAQRSLLFAGGIGITPLLAMTDRLHADGAEFSLHYCTRSSARTAFRDRLLRGPYAGRVQLHHDDGAAAQKLDMAGVLAQPDAGTHVYVCGPTGYLDAVRATARDRGWPDTQVHFEYFAGLQPHSADDRSFDLVLAKSGRTVRVQAAETCTDALHAAGVDVPVSCQQGVCGTCLTRVIDGAVDHKDLYLTPEEQAADDQFLPCCSRAAGARLVIDL